MNSHTLRIKPEPGQIYGVMLWWGDTEIIRTVKATGGHWDPEVELWMPEGSWGKRLGLTSKIRTR